MFLEKKGKLLESMDLVEYLSELNTKEKPWVDYLADLNVNDFQLGIWIDLKNPRNEYRIGRIGNPPENPDWKFIGDLQSLSFLNVSVTDFLTDIAQERGVVNVDEFKEMYLSEELPEIFQQEVEGEIYLRAQIRAQAAARQFVENLMEVQ